MGTNVVSGTAVAVVAATGDATCFSAMAKEIVGARPLTSFDKGISKVSWMLIRFLMAVSVAVGLTPEMLPDDRDYKPCQRCSDDGTAQDHRETAERNPEFRRNGHPLH